MRKSLFGLFALGLLTCLASAPAHAQDRGRITVFGGYSYMLNSWGNGCVSSCASGLTTGLHGYTGSLVYNFTDNIGLEANFSGHNGSPTVFSEAATSTVNGYTEFERQDIYTYTFGPKLTAPVGDFSIFGHFLIGAAHGHEGFTDQCLQSSGSDSTCGSPYSTSSSGSGFAIKAGGGVDWNHGHWGVRIAEVDFVRASTFVTESCSDCVGTGSFGLTANNIELSTGVTISFK